MKKLHDVLALDIYAGNINWEKLQQKVFVALELINKQIHSKSEDGQIDKTMKMEDALTFKSKSAGTELAYKIYAPRFKNGELYCSGFQTGYYLPTGKPVMISQKVNF